MIRARYAALAAAALVALTACGGGAATVAPTTAPATAKPATAAPATAAPASAAPATAAPATAAPATAEPATAAPATPEASVPAITPAPTPSANCTDTAPSDPAPAGIPTDLGAGTLTVWEAYGASGSAERDAFCSMVANVKAANPGLVVEVLDYPFSALFNTFELQAASGGGPDLYIAPNDSLPTEARAALLADLTSFTDQLKAAPYNISDTALTADTVDGKLSAIPESMKAVATFYRTDIFPTAPATTADWLKPENAPKLGLVYGGNGGGAYYQWGLYGAFGGKILADDGKCAATATTGVADSLKFLSDFKAAGGHLYQNDGDASADFTSGKIGAFIDGPWKSGDFKSAAPKGVGALLGVAPGPTGPAGAFQPMAAPDGYYINDSSQNKDLAIKFAMAMLTPANEQIFVDQAGHIPANTTMTIADPIAAGFQTAIETGFARPTAKELNNYWGNFGDAIVKAVDAGTDPTTLVADACSKMDAANAGS